MHLLSFVVSIQSLSMPKDTAKLKKHIALMCERLNKGAKLDLSGQSDLTYKGENRKPLETLDESVEENEDTTGNLKRYIFNSRRGS